MTRENDFRDHSEVFHKAWTLPSRKGVLGSKLDVYSYKSSKLLPWTLIILYLIYNLATDTLKTTHEEHLKAFRESVFLKMMVRDVSSTIKSASMFFDGKVIFYNHPRSSDNAISD